MGRNEALIYRVQGGHHQHQQGGSDGNADAQRCGEGQQELRLDGAFEDQWREGEERRRGSQEDRTEAPLGALDDRGARGRALLSRA